MGGQQWRIAVVAFMLLVEFTFSFQFWPLLRVLPELRQRAVSVRLAAAAADRFGDGTNNNNWKQQQQHRPLEKDDNNRGSSRDESRRNNDNYNDARAPRGESERRPRRREQLHNNEPPEQIYAYYLATCLPGMAGILQEELVSLGCVAVEPSGKSAVHFGVTDLPTVLRVLLWTRTAHKVMELLTSTHEPVYTRQDVYQFVRDTVPVTDLLLASSSDKDWLTVSVSVTLNNAKHIPEDINHSHYTALNVKNALVDAARAVNKADSRPSVDTADADVPLAVVLRGIPSEARFYGSTTRADPYSKANFATTGPSIVSAGAHMSIYRCIHAGSLHRRGYRYGTAVHKAAMKESTAAGLLLAAGWHKTCQTTTATSTSTTTAVLVDPMMGSATFLLEGAMIAADLAPGLMRLKCGVPASLNPPILRWNHDDISSRDLEAVWNELLTEATTRAKNGLELIKGKVQIVGNDIHGGAFELADHALRQAGLSKVVQLHCNDCLDWKIPEASESPWMVVSNPPWGVRLSEDMHESWEALRVFLRERCPGGSEAWILSGSPEATKHLGLRRSQSLPLQTGEHDLRWLQYTIRDKNDTTAASDRAALEQRPRRSPDLVQSRAPREESRKLASERPKRTSSKAPPAKPVDNEWMI
jgi:23S rRNA G2445 N2-methylase RlmL